MDKNSLLKENKIKGKGNILSFMDHNRYVFLFIMVVCFILYGNTIRNEYSLDDQFVADQNAQINQGISALPKIFTSLYTVGTKQSFGYRPMVKATFAIEHQFTKGNPHFSHFVNILLYVLCCYLLFLVLKKIFPNFNNLVFSIAVLLFTANPLHTEVVASLKNRDELLCFLFAFLSALFVLKFTEETKVWQLLLALIFYILAYLSKFSVISFIALLPLFVFFRDKKQWWKIVLVFGLFLLLTLALRYYINKALPPGFRPRLFYENPLSFEPNMIKRIPTGMVILLFYLGKLIFPHPLVSYYGYDMIKIADWSDWQVYVSVLLHLALLVIAVYNLRKRPLLTFSILFYFISIAMYTSVIRPVMGIVAERFLLLPSIAFSIILSYYSIMLFKIDMIPSVKVKLPVKFVALILLILLPYSAKTIDRNKDWYNLMSLLEADIPHAWNSVKMNSLYAGEMLEEILADIDEGKNLSTIQSRADIVKKHLLRSTDLFQKDFTSWNNLGTLYFTVYADYQKAIYFYQQALESNPFNAEEPYYNIGVSYFKLNKFDLAVKAQKEAILIKPDFMPPYLLIADVYLEKKDFQNALLAGDQMIATFPESDQGHLYKGKTYLAQNDTISAIVCFENALKVDSSNYELAFSLRDYFSARGDAEKARYYENMGNLYYLNK